MNLKRHQRQHARWRILKTLDSGRPYKVVESLMHRVIADSHLPSDREDLRRELDYLSDKGLLDLDRSNRDEWAAELTAKGVDVVEYSIDAPPGIARPDE